MKNSPIDASQNIYIKVKNRYAVSNFNGDDFLYFHFDSNGINDARYIQGATLRKEKDNIEMALSDLDSIQLNGDPVINNKKKIVKRIYKEYLRDMNELIDRWYSLRLIQSLKED